MITKFLPDQKKKNCVKEKCKDAHQKRETICHKKMAMLHKNMFKICLIFHLLLKCDISKLACQKKCNKKKQKKTGIPDIKKEKN